MATTTKTTTPVTTRPQTFQGVVVKAAMKDTVTVAVSRYVKHPKYKKYQVRTKKYLVEDTGNTTQIGDKVTIQACAPLSKLKHFRIIGTQAAIRDSAE
jgi:small subunit ribosomal protein S17